MSTKIEITLERDDETVTIWSTDPMIHISRDIVGNGDPGDDEIIDLYRDALSAHRESLSVPA